MNDNISNSFLFIILIILTIIVSVGLYYKYGEMQNEEKLKMKKIREGATSLGKIFKSIGSMFKIIASIPKRIANVGKGIGSIFKGIGQEFSGVVEGTALGFKDIVLLVYYSGYFTFTYVICGVQYITNIPKCFFYYMTDIFGQLLYLPIRIILLILGFVYGMFLNNMGRGFRMIYGAESSAWKGIYKLDIIIYNIIGFRFTRWPKSIRDKCYNCKRLKISVLAKKSKDVHKDFTQKLPAMLMRGIKTMRSGGNKLISAFQ